MTPVQIKLAVAGGIALLAWLLTSRAAGARVSQTLDIDANLLSPTFGLTDEEIAARKANPAVDPEMRRLIDLSNSVLAADAKENP